MIVYKGRAHKSQARAAAERQCYNFVRDMATLGKFTPGTVEIRFGVPDKDDFVPFIVEFLPENCGQSVSKGVQLLSFASDADIAAAAAEYRELIAEMDSLLEYSNITEAKKARLSKISARAQYLKSEFML